MGVPLAPDRATAREWLLHELSDPDYVPGSGPWARIRSILNGLGLSPSTLLWLLLGVIVLSAAVGVLLFAGLPQRGARRRTGSAGASDDDRSEPASAADFRARAERAAAEHRFSQAVLDRFRAIVRSLEERAVLETRPDRTADEAAREAAALLPDRGAELASAALMFDDVCYGGRAGTPAGYEALTGIDTRVTAARPLQPADAGPTR
jgi:Domain of unknown function (DUF4129)